MTLPMSMTAPSEAKFNKAVDAWYDSEGKRFDFCELAADYVGDYEEGKAAKLAKSIERSIPTVQNYAKVGKFWREVLKAYPSDAELFRADLQTGYWLPVARLWANNVMSLELAKDCMSKCRLKKLEGNWSVDKFRIQLPTLTKGLEGQSEYAATLRQLKFRVDSLMATVDEAMNAPTFGVDPAGYKKFYRALKLVKGRSQYVMRK